MIILSTIVTLILIIILSAFVLGVQQVRRLKAQQQKIRELFWQRRSRIPLFIELAFPNNREPEVTGIIKMRQELSACEMIFSEEVIKENTLHEALQNVRSQLQNSPSYKANTALISLEKELDEMQSAVIMALAEFKYQKAKLDKYPIQVRRHFVSTETI